MATAVLELRGVGKSYGWLRPRPALQGVWLKVERGECFGLAGPNGAGKTTLIRLMLGLALPDEGEARLFGERPEDPELRRRVGFVPESGELSPNASPRQLVRRWVRMRNLPPAAVQQGLQCLDRLGVSALLDRPVGRFSKGEKQRTLLSLALLGQPELLVLDEPTDGLDPLGRALVRQVVREECAAGRTIFLNSHLLSETEKMCTRVGILHRGRLERVHTLERAPHRGPGTSVVVVEQAPAPEVLARAGARLAPPGAPALPELQPGQVLLLEHPSVQALNEAVDVLREAGTLMLELRPLRADLEAALVEVATGGGADREVPTEELGKAVTSAAPEPPAWANEPVPPTPAVPLRPLRALDAMRRVAQEILAELASQRIGWMLLLLAVLAVLVLGRVLQAQLLVSATQVTRSAVQQLDSLAAAQLVSMVSSGAAQGLFWFLLVLLTVMSSLFAVPLLEPRRTVLLYAQPLSRADHVVGLLGGVVVLAGAASLGYAAAVLGVLRWFGLEASPRLLLTFVPLVVAFAPLYAVVLLATLAQRSGLFAAICGLSAFGACLALGNSEAVEGVEGSSPAVRVLYAGVPKLVELGRQAGRLAEGGPLLTPPLLSTLLVTAALTLVVVVVASRREA